MSPGAPGLEVVKNTSHAMDHELRQNVGCPAPCSAEALAPSARFLGSQRLRLRLLVHIISQHARSYERLH
eukprot:811702-Alexandrium_andersonii.AAC.1